MRAPSKAKSPCFPLISRPSEDEQAPVVVSIPHAGIVFPAEERPLYWGGNVDRLLTYGDLYTDLLFGDAWHAGATVISTPYNRFVIDLNRFADDLSPSLLKGYQRIRGPGYYGDRGVIWAVDTYGAKIYRRPLTREVIDRRISRYYAPYHEALASELARLRERFGRVVLIDGHSMPSEAAPLHADSGERRADIVPGDLKGQSCGAWLTELTEAYWTSRGYSVATNQPYVGGATTRRYAAPDDGVHTIQVELNRALYMNERTLRKRFGFTRLRRHVTAYVEAVVDGVRSA